LVEYQLSPEPEPEQEKSLAALLVNYVLRADQPFPIDQSLRRRIKERFSIQTPVGSLKLFLNDAEQAAQAFRFQSIFVESSRMNFPCLDIDPVPIPLSLGLEQFADTSDLDGAQKVFGEVTRTSRFREIQESWPSAKIGDYSIEEAHLFFRHRLKEFFAVRVAAMGLFEGTTGAPPGPPGKPGLKFTVNTNSNGLRVYYSPAYWMQARQVLNFPSTPVVGWIQPGRYYFGAGKPGSSPTFDTSALLHANPGLQSFQSLLST
jgi:hypothetical protein